MVNNIQQNRPDFAPSLIQGQTTVRVHGKGNNSRDVDNSRSKME